MTVKIGGNFSKIVPHFAIAHSFIFIFCNYSSVKIILSEEICKALRKKGTVNPLFSRPKTVKPFQKGKEPQAVKPCDPTSRFLKGFLRVCAFIYFIPNLYGVVCELTATARQRCLCSRTLNSKDSLFFFEFACLKRLKLSFSILQLESPFLAFCTAELGLRSRFKCLSSSKEDGIETSLSYRWPHFGLLG